MSDSDGSLTVGEVARRAGLRPSAVRYYEAEGLIPVAERVGGWRRFSPTVLDRLALIRMATHVGFSLKEVKVLVGALDAGGTGTPELAALAQAKVPEVEAVLARTQGLLELLRSAAACHCPTLQACVARFEAQGSPP